VKRLPCSAGLVLLATIVQVPRPALGQATPGYPERVLQWTVLPGESCEDVASALYGSKTHAALLDRYNNTHCARGGDLPDGLTLVVPEKVSEVAPATLHALAPDVREKPPGGTWILANPGMPLYRNHSVNTLDRARADIMFVDRSRIVMAAHTLVVIYGTAGDSEQSKRAATVELEEGELQAGIMALRGRSPTVGVKGGGEVTAHSRDTVVRSKAKRSTVSVFDGKAKVRSGGAAVDVPQNFGTSFVASAPPTRPRPLPPGPHWTEGSDEGVIIAEPGGAVLKVAWNPIDKAASYRFEAARDPDFRDLTVREEIPATITAFRAERMPSGHYYLRIRAIDKDDFLGLASTTRGIQVVALAIDGPAGKVGRGVLEVSAYARLAVKADDDLELSIDDSPFDRVPKSLDLMQRPANKLRWRQRGTATELTYQLRYLPLGTHAWLDTTATPSQVHVTFSGLSDSAVIGRVRPKLRAHYGSTIREVSLQRVAGEQQFLGHMPTVERSTLSHVDVVDFRGRTLATLQPPPSSVVPKPSAPAFDGFETGPCVPLVPSSTNVSVSAWAPTACNAVSGAVIADNANGVWAERAFLRASAMIGQVGFEALIQSGLTPAQRRRGDDALWLGARWRAATFGRRWSMGPSLRLAMPPTSASPTWRFETGWAISGQFDHWSVLLDLGARAAAWDEQRRLATPAEQGLLIFGLGHDFSRLFRAFALVDGHVVARDQGPAVGRAGLALAAETRGPVFASWALRLSPWQDAGGQVAAQLAVGLRE
jgi:hypothetical protein